MLTNENFKEKLEMDGFSLVLISGDGCANCTTMYPIIQEVANNVHDLSVYNVEIDSSNNAINDFYGVEVVPTILFLHHGDLISKVQGYQPQEILQIYVEAKMDEYKQKSNLN